MVRSIASLSNLWYVVGAITGSFIISYVIGQIKNSGTISYTTGLTGSGGGVGRKAYAANIIPTAP